MPAAPTPITVPPLTANPPREVARVRHEIMEGVPQQCDCCQQPIEGPRFECVNCHSFQLCISCELAMLGNSTTISEASQQLLRLHARHLFVVHLRAETHEEEFSYLYDD